MLGTAQIGLDYGVMNVSGRPDRRVAHALLDRAVALGVRSLDTAHAYGIAEEVLGTWLAERSADCEIVTKLSPLADPIVESAGRCIGESLHRLGRNRVEGLLLHRAADIRRPGLRQWVREAISTGRIGAFGVSIYDVSEIEDDEQLHLLQLPANIFVQSAATHPRVAHLAERGCRLIVRSVFAQGLLLAAADRIPAAQASCVPYLARIDALSNAAGISKAALAIATVRALIPSATLVIGAESPAQIDGIAAACTEPVPIAVVEAALAIGRSAPEELFDPRRWQARSAS
jgi:aryl-alcohol dehydrogenase-like predicted oxidoreductase